MKGEVRLCKKGHEKRQVPSGGWVCRTCHAASNRRWYMRRRVATYGEQAARVPGGPCGKGHKRHLVPSGRWICRICVNESHRRSYRISRGDMFGKRSGACRRGHPHTDKNTYIVPHNGHRVCRVCRNALARLSTRRERGDAFGERYRAPTCGRGHPYTDENTYVTLDGKRRMCRACARDRAVFGCGHPYTEKNAYFNQGGKRRMCKTCARARDAHNVFGCGHRRTPENTRVCESGWRICAICRSGTHCNRGHSDEEHGRGNACRECRRRIARVRRDVSEAVLAGEDPGAVSRKYEAMGYSVSRLIRTAVALVNDKEEKQQWRLGKKRLRIARRKPNRRKALVALGAPKSPTPGSKPERTSRT